MQQVNMRGEPFLETKHTVYRYTDLYNGVVKYVGLTQRPLKRRVEEHIKNDAWTKTSKWRIEYFTVANKSESEAWESHLIALYKTFNWFNIAKKDWGLIGKFQTTFPYWNVYSIDEDIVDFDFSKLPVVKDTRDLVSDIEIMIDNDINRDWIYILIARRHLQPLAKNKNGNLLFWYTDAEKVRTYI